MAATVLPPAHPHQCRSKHCDAMPSPYDISAAIAAVGTKLRPPVHPLPPPSGPSFSCAATSTTAPRIASALPLAVLRLLYAAPTITATFHCSSSTAAALLPQTYRPPPKQYRHTALEQNDNGQPRCCCRCRHRCAGGSTFRRLRRHFGGVACSVVSGKIDAPATPLPHPPPRCPQGQAGTLSRLRAVNR